MTHDVFWRLKIYISAMYRSNLLDMYMKVQHVTKVFVYLFSILDIYLLFNKPFTASLHVHVQLCGRSLDILTGYLIIVLI